MKKIIRIIFIIMSAITLTFSTKVFAATTYPAYGQYKLTWNIENIYYYIDSSATNYSSIIESAANNWVYTGLGYNKLWLNTRIYDILGTAVDFYAYEGGTTGIEATTYTYIWVNGVKTDVPWVGISGRANTGVPSANYTFAEIVINNTQMQSNASYYTTGRKQGIIAHEFGHCWGLGHNPENQDSLMHNYSNYRKNTVQQVDQDVFNILYP